jgi:uncharacterized membrane protein
MREKTSTWMLIASLGAVAGVRSMQAPALLSRCLRTSSGGDAGRASSLLTAPVAVGALRLLSVGEMVADKLPFIPARTTLLPLAGRIASGAISGAALAGARNVSRVRAMAIGASVAVGSAFVATLVRKLATERFHVPNVAMGLVEDAVVSAACRRIGAAIA